MCKWSPFTVDIITIILPKPIFVCDANTSVFTSYCLMGILTNILLFICCFVTRKVKRLTGWIVSAIYVHMIPKSVQMFNSSLYEYKTYSPFRSFVGSWEYLIHVEKRPLVQIVRSAFLLTTSQATSFYRDLKHWLAQTVVSDDLSKPNLVILLQIIC